MVPPVALHDTAISALSPVAVKPTARKSSAWFCCRVTVCGDTTSCAMMEPRSVTGCSQLTTIVATATAATIATGSLSRARRAASLCVKGIRSLPKIAPSLSSPLRREELAHVRRTGRPAREHRTTEPLEDQPQRARVLVQRRGLIAAFRLWAHSHPYDASAAGPGV